MIRAVPYRPEWAETIDGLADACRALGLPVVCALLAAALGFAFRWLFVLAADAVLPGDLVLA